MAETLCLSFEEVEALARDALLAAGTREEAAASLARSVALTERDGIRSHGLVYVPIYCQHVTCGKVDGQAVPKLHEIKPGAFRVDAANGFAQPAIDLGFERLVAAAGQNGCAVLTLYNSYNCGVLGQHVERLAAQGFLALGFTNAPASIAPPGGKRPVIGTNPFAVGVPGGDEAAALVIIDQSASVVAKSEVMMHARGGKPLPEGWALDAEGNSTTDPEAALAGSMAPSGGYKGFGVGLLVEIMAAALSGANLGTEASPFSGTSGGPPGTGQGFIAIEPDGLSGGAFPGKIAALCESITEQEGARLPGARRFGNRLQNERDGIQVDRDLVEKLRALAGV